MSDSLCYDVCVCVCRVSAVHDYSKFRLSARRFSVSNSICSFICVFALEGSLEKSCSGFLDLNYGCEHAYVMSRAATTN